MAVKENVDAAMLELNISYLAPRRFYGPPQKQMAWGQGIRKAGTDCRPEYKWQEPTNFSNYRQWSKR